MFPFFPLGSLASVMRTPLSRFVLAGCLGWLAAVGGCSRKSDPDSVPISSIPEVEETNPKPEPGELISYEFTAEDLLAARLPEEQAHQGWVRLFDGHTLFGWQIAGKANWRIEDGSIVVDSGEQSLLCTSVPWQDYELSLEFQAGPETNSGVFLRTPLQPDDPQTDCYEVNIAPDDNPFPTASVVKRLKADAEEEGQPFDQWREMTMKLQGNQLQVSVDGKLVCDYTDPIGLTAGRIGLQHNSGSVAFKNIRLRPLGAESLLDPELSQWTKYPEMPGEFSMTEEGWMRVQGGRTQLETKQSYADFVLLAEYKLPEDDMNSGIFFRCIPGAEMMGYECQVSNEMVDGMPLQPADWGSGGIFKRQSARIVAGESGKWASLVLVAHGDKIAAWVNGVQVSDWQDDRPPHENPRKGLRLEAGTIMIQGHDPGTDALLKRFAIAPISGPVLSEGPQSDGTPASGEE